MRLFAALVCIGFLVALACQTREPNPLLGKWELISPDQQAQMELIFNNDGTFAWVLTIDTRRSLIEGNYSRDGRNVTLEVNKTDGSPDGAREINARMDEAEKELAFSDVGRDLRFKKK
jgi:uncharacterized protein (TIGR03066 family)